MKSMQFFVILPRNTIHTVSSNNPTSRNLWLIFNYFAVPEDDDLDALLRLAISWDSDWTHYVDLSTGEAKRPAGSLPIEADLALDLAFNPGFEVGALSLSWQHLQSVANEDWSQRRKDEYAAYILSRLNALHSKHCRQEMYYSISSNYCEYFTHCFFFLWYQNEISVTIETFMVTAYLTLFP
jgi:hypothetical protein